MSTSSEKRAQNDAKREEACDKINNFESFHENVGLRYRQFKVITDGESDLYMSHTDPIGRRVIRFIHFQKVDSHFGFLYLANAEKDIVVPKKEFPLQKNSLVSKWTQIDDMDTIINCYKIWQIYHGF